MRQPIIYGMDYSGVSPRSQKSLGLCRCSWAQRHELTRMMSFWASSERKKIPESRATMSRFPHQSCLGFIPLVADMLIKPIGCEEESLVPGLPEDTAELRCMESASAQNVLTLQLMAGSRRRSWSISWSDHVASGSKRAGIGLLENPGRSSGELPCRHGILTPTVCCRGYS